MKLLIANGYIIDPAQQSAACAADGRGEPACASKAPTRYSAVAGRESGSRMEVTRRMRVARHVNDAVARATASAGWATVCNGV